MSPAGFLALGRASTVGFSGDAGNGYVNRTRSNQLLVFTRDDVDSKAPLAIQAVLRPRVLAAVIAVIVVPVTSANAAPSAQASASCTTKNESVKTKTGFPVVFVTASGVSCESAKSAVKNVSWKGRLVWPGWKCRLVAKTMGGRFSCKKGAAKVAFTIVN